MTRVLFVCMGNICRSPAAEGVFRQVVAERKMQDRVSVDSAGTIDYHSGEPADGRMRGAAERRGYRLESVARGFRREDFERFDWIVTMDDANHRDILGQARTDAERAKIRRFTDWVELPGVREVPDPYYGGASGFDRVLDILEDGCGRLLDWIVEFDGTAGKTS